MGNQNSYGHINNVQNYKTIQTQGTMAFVQSKGLVQNHALKQQPKVNRNALTRYRSTSTYMTVSSQVARESTLMTDLEKRISNQIERGARLGVGNGPTITVHQGGFAPLLQDF